MTTSPTRTKQKLSLRKRLFVKKSPKVGCYVDTDSNDEFSQSTSRSISPADPFLAHSVPNYDSNLDTSDNQRNSSTDTVCHNVNQSSERLQNDEDINPKCCRTFFRRSRPKSLVDGPPSKDENSSPCSPVTNSVNSLNDQTITSAQSKSDEIRKVIKTKNDDIKKCFEHSGSFEAIKTKNKLFVKRLSADHLISTEAKSLYRSSSPESDRSSSLDRKRR